MTGYTSERFPTLGGRSGDVVVPARTTSRSARLLTGHYIVLGTLAAVVTVRFFTEELHVLPRAANFIDVPLLFLMVGAAIATETRTRPIARSPVFILGVCFLAVTTVSAIANLHRVDVFPALAFVYGFLAPPAYYLAVYRLWRPGRAQAVSNLLIGIAIIQFVTIGGVDLPQFLRYRNPDAISGTFGTNAYQLVFFLMWFIALVTGIVTFQPRSRVRFFAIPFLVTSFLAIFLAQYRTILLTMALATLFIGILLIRRERGLFIGAAAVAGLLVGLIFVLAYVPTNKFTQAIDAIHNDPGYFIKSRLDPADDVYHLYGDNAAYAVIGAGPGTYSSRAWNTFAEINSASNSDVAGPYASWLMGGHPYQTDVSNKYVLPRLNAPAKYGTYQFANPFSSYLALAAEVGIIGLFLLLAMYLLAFTRLVRAALYFARHAVPGDPLPALVLATATAFFILLQIAIFGNWFETARVTVPTWIVFGVVARELAARPEFERFGH